MCGVMDGIVVVFDVKMGKCVYMFVGYVVFVCDVMFFLDGKTLYTASDDGYAYVYDVYNKLLIEFLSGYKSWVLFFIVFFDGIVFVIGFFDVMIKFWDLKTRSCA